MYEVTNIVKNKLEFQRIITKEIYNKKDISKIDKNIFFKHINNLLAEYSILSDKYIRIFERCKAYEQHASISKGNKYTNAQRTVNELIKIEHDNNGGLILNGKLRR